jgi:hypothetical protein
MKKSRTNQAWTDPLVRQLVREHGGDTPEDAITAYTNRLLQESGHTRLPIAVDNIASLIGIKMRSAAHEFAGRIYAEPNGQLVMDLRSTDNPRRQRFTCSHEIIHTAFPGFSRGRFRLDESVGHYERHRAEEEYLCDAGAAELLMPADMLKDSLSNSATLSAIEKLSRDAKVSLEAAGNRVVTLADEPMAFLVLEVMNKPADRPRIKRGERVPPRLRVRYARTQRIPIFIPRFKSVDRRSPFGRALRAEDLMGGDCELPGSAETFRVEAKRYPRAGGDGQIDRVLAVAHPLR